MDLSWHLLFNPGVSFVRSPLHCPQNPNIMAGQPNTLIVLGSSPDSYYIGHGRRHFVENMPDSFTEHAKKDLTISMTRWISVNKNMDWVSYNDATENMHFNTGINQTVLDHLSGVNGKFGAEYVSFPGNEDPAHYFVKGRGQSQWSGYLDDYFIAKLLKAQKEVPNFDADLTGILFGKGKTFIIMSKTGFTAHLDDDEIPSSSEEHPLRKVLEQYSEGWCIDRASTLCFYDSKYFFIKFRGPGESQIMMHWNLPPHMNEKLRELQELMQQPEEKLTLTQEDQMWLNVFQSRLNNGLQMSMMFANQMHRGGLGLLAVATGGTVVETPRY
ncbi:hypothetical protein MVEN_01297100 [Mycena venus]|uniref:Uncharacterized protein n=1 Tax=Mycena venus TaxID=2733690 RepID=A0A8H7CTS6_9AGAR|nr:hypothetical protein MVEN_01297100 [Mycena venus]